MEPTEKLNDRISSEPQVITDVACNRCSCLCDDLTIGVEGQRVTSVAPACPIAEPWFLSQRGDASTTSRVRGIGVAEEVAVSEAAQLLREAHSPLIYGLTTCSTDGQRAAVALADGIGARLQVEVSPTAAAALAAFQTAGASTATLGEIRERADLIIYWGCDPMTTHPRHIERFVDVPGRWMPKGRGGRHVVSIQSPGDYRDCRDDFADARLIVESRFDGELIALLRSHLQNGQEIYQGNPDPSKPRELAGLSEDEFDGLITRMKNCSYGVIFYGDQIASGKRDASTLHALHRMVTELNAFSRFTIRHLNAAPNGTGASNVMAWQTGYANNVNFANGFPAYEPNEATLENLAAAGAVDLVLFVGSDSPPRLTAAASEHLREIPCIVVRHVETESESVGAGWSPINPVVEIETGVPGIHAPGVYYRMDDVPLPLRRVFETNLSADEDVLNAIMTELSVITGSRV